jgi:hypothetical protein
MAEVAVIPGRHTEHPHQVRAQQPQEQRGRGWRPPDRQDPHVQAHKKQNGPELVAVPGLRGLLGKFHEPMVDRCRTFVKALSYTKH